MKPSAMNWRHAPTASTNSWPVDAKELAGESLRAILTSAPGNGESIGGLNVVTDDGWLAALLSGTDVYTLTRNVSAQASIWNTFSRRRGRSSPECSRQASGSPPAA